MVRIRRPKTSLEERLAMALQYIREHGFMRLADYANLTGLSRTGASRELSAFCRDASCPIRSEGVRTHKVFVEAK